MGGHAAAWLAWLLVALSVALLVGGIAMSRAASSTVPNLPFGGETDDASVVANLVTLLPFSVVGYHRFPPPPQHHRLALLQRRRDDRCQRLRGGLCRVLAREWFRHEEPRRDGGVV